MKRKVFFIIDNNRYEAEYNSDNLRLGNLVYITFDKDSKPELFQSIPTKNSIPYCIQWIAPSDWTIWLVNQIEITSDLKDKTIKACSDFLPSETVETALSDIAKKVSLNNLFKTSEYLKNKTTIVYTVTERLSLSESLADPTIEKKLFSHLRPLRIYLYLTCFDRLGQPADWLDFGAWLNSKNSVHIQERQNAIENIPDGLSIDQASKALHAFYTNIYGVKSSFYRFITDILPQKYRDKLLNSIIIEKSSLPPKMNDIPPGSESEKMKFLFATRNKYTHEALYVPGVGESVLLQPAIKGWYVYTQEIHHDYFLSIKIWDWPNILKESVQVGLSVYVQNMTK